MVVEPDVELAAELIELQRAGQRAARATDVATFGPIVAELLGDLAAAPHALDLTARDLHPERRDAAELEHLDAVGSCFVRVGRVSEGTKNPSPACSSCEPIFNEPATT